MIREGQVYKWVHLAEENRGYGYNRTAEVTEVVRVKSIDGNMVIFQIGSHTGNLTATGETSVKSFMDSINSKTYELIKDVPLEYVPPINRLSMVGDD